MDLRYNLEAFKKHYGKIYTIYFTFSKILLVVLVIYIVAALISFNIFNMILCEPLIKIFIIPGVLNSILLLPIVFSLYTSQKETERDRTLVLGDKLYQKVEKSFFATPINESGTDSEGRIRKRYTVLKIFSYSECNSKYIIKGEIEYKLEFLKTDFSPRTIKRMVIHRIYSESDEKKLTEYLDSHIIK